MVGSHLSDPQQRLYSKTSYSADGHLRNPLSSYKVGYQHNKLLNKQLRPSGIPMKGLVADEHQLWKSQLLPKQLEPTGVPYGAFRQSLSSLMNIRVLTAD